MQESHHRAPRDALVSSLSGFFSRPVALFLLATAIFIADTVTDLEIAVAVFYTAVVLMSVTSYQRRGVLLVSAACVGLTLASFILTPGGSFSAGLANGLISVVAIVVTTYLALQIEEARLAMQASQAEIARFARITVLGELTASIAHEIKQPLTGVVANGNACMRWLSVQPPELDEARSAVAEAVKDAMRASEIVTRVRAMAKRTPVEKAPVDLNEVIVDTIGLIQTDIQQSGISMRTELAGGLPTVTGDRVQLQQVVLNLLGNAIEAIRYVPEGQRDLLITTASDDAGHVHAVVRDTGTGLKQDERERVFDAFYTTKPEGMGMGLAISRSIIEAHGGRISAEPNSPRGVTVKFTLPPS